MKRMIRLALLVTLVLGVGLSCQNTLSGTPEPLPRLGPNEGRLTVTFGDNWLSASTILPGIDVEIDSYLITLTGPDGTLTHAVSPPQTSASFAPLTPGEWSVEVQARNELEEVIGVGSTVGTVTVDGGQTTEVSITVGPEPGDGTLELSFAWPAVVADGLEVDIYSIDDLDTPLGQLIGPGDAVLNGNGDAYSASYDGDFEAGSYLLRIRLLDGVDQVFGYFPSEVAVWIIQGRLSSGTYTTGGAIVVNVGSDLNLYTFDFSFEPDGDLTATDSISVTLDPDTLDPEPDWIRWYLNGDLLEPPSTATSRVLGELPAGRYWLDVVVRKGNVLSSHGEPFEVLPD